MRKFSMKAIAIASIVSLAAAMAVSVSPASANCRYVHIDNKFVYFCD